MQDSEPKPKPDRRRSALQKRAALRPPMPLTDRRLIRPAAQICDRAALLAARELGDNRLRHFAFRGVSPAIAGEPLHLAIRKAEAGYELAAFAGDGRQVTQASAQT